MWIYMMWGFLLLSAIIGYVFFCRWMRKDAENMIAEFEKKFPNRCPICSYHDYGVREGFIPPSPPGEHPGCLTKTEEK